MIVSYALSLYLSLPRIVLCLPRSSLWLKTPWTVWNVPSLTSVVNDDGALKAFLGRCNAALLPRGVTLLSPIPTKYQPH